MKIAVNKAHFPVTVLGPGRRIGIWLQGCSIGCKGCVSQDTWASDDARLMALPTLLNWCRQVSGGLFDGVTISGGEPFDQPQALSALLAGLHAWRSQAGIEFDILCYSGYPLAKLQRLHARLLQKLDALIPEPFIEAQSATRHWRGSDNQPLVLLSERGRAVYARWADTLNPGTDADNLKPDPVPAAKRIQLMQDGEQIWYVGIPARGDMAALESACAAKGIAFSQVSWRP